jgi:hypothetical protein
MKIKGPSMEYEERFTSAELVQIIDEGLVYMCACPAQVADAMRKLRELHRYQLDCLQDPQNASPVHQAIAASTVRAHAQMQECLIQVLELEHWDRATLTMPEGLRQRQLQEILGD